MIVVVGSTSALKLRAVQAAFDSLHLVQNSINIRGCAAESDVRPQPNGLREMEEGARNRAAHARRLQPGADYYVGIENGLVLIENDWFDVPCIWIEDAGGLGQLAVGAHFPIPHWIVHRVLDNHTELGAVIQELAGGGEKDPMAYLSCGNVSREAILTEAVRCALVPLASRDRYTEPA